MIPTNKLKKLILQCIVKFIDSVQIWEDCSVDMLETIENHINPLQVKEIFCKEILPDLSYNNFGYDNEIIEKLKSLKTTSNGTGSINWMEVDKDIDDNIESRMADLHSESLIESAEEETYESEGDASINAILAKYNIPGHISSSQAPICYQESEQLYCFRESQLINVFNIVESDPLANNSNIEATNETGDYDAYDYLCDGGRISEVFNHAKPSTSFDITTHRSETLKRKSNSLSIIDLVPDLDEKASDPSKPKRSRLSNSLDEDRFSSISDAETRPNELDSVIKQLENDGNKVVEEFVKHFEEKINNDSKITDNNENVQKSTDEIVAEIQKRLNEAKSNDEYQKLLEENIEYLTMLVIPANGPEILLQDEPENKESDTNKSSKTAEESQIVKNISKPEVKSVGIKFPRKLKTSRPKLTYDITECSDSISQDLQDEALNPLLLNDTIISGSHKDCIGIVKDLEILNSSSNTSKSQRGSSLSSHKSYSSSSKDHSNSAEKQSAEKAVTEEEIIEKLQALINMAKSPEEINKILNENEEYRYYLTLPFIEPESLKTPPKSPQKSKEEVIKEIQNKLDNAKDSDEIDKIFKENEKYLEYLIFPYIEPDLTKNVQSIDAKPSQKVKQETKAKENPKLKIENNLERNSSRAELSFLLSQNVNIKRKKTAVPLPKAVDKNVIIDLIDDDD